MFLIDRDALAEGLDCLSAPATTLSWSGDRSLTTSLISSRWRPSTAGSARC